MPSLRHSLSLCICVFALCIASYAAPHPSCALNNTNQTVTICTPFDGAALGTTFTVNAGASDTNPIVYMQVYVAYKLYATQHSNALDATITVPAGVHQNLTVQAHDSTGLTFKTTIHVNVSASTPFTVSPQDPAVPEGTTRQFSASAPATWTASCGSIDATGLFTAPLSQPTCSVMATATDGSGHTASSAVAISSPVAITPVSATTLTGASQPFAANTAVSWAASCGSITSAGLFTAPSAPATCTITATASAGTAYTATATDSVIVPSTNPLNYTTWKYDNARDGLQPNESLLTPANVNASTFGPIFATAVDDTVWAQPLYMNGVTIGSATHNVVYVATANDSVYAIDGDNGAQLWKANLVPTGETPANGVTIHSSIPKIGITGTPVIDSTTGTIYLVTQSVTTSGSNYYHRLHALDITSGAEKFGGPVIVNAPGWASSEQLQRPGLLLANGNVYFAFGGNQDISPYHGWLFAYNAANLSQAAAWNDTIDGGEGGIWMGGGGIPADPNGTLFVPTGNGDWNGSTQFGQSVVKLSPSLSVLDYFTPYDHVEESAADKDLGSGGVLLLPDLTGPYLHEAVSCSKLNSIYVLNRDDLGELGTTGDNVVQHVDGQLGSTSGTQYTDRCFSTPAFWNNNLYFIGNNDVLKQFTLNPSTGMMSTTPVYQNTFAYLFPGGQPVVSASGSTSAIVWAIDWTTGTLRAYDATNVSTAFYTSPKLGGGSKFTVPTVVNGHVYVGLMDKVVALGLLPSTTCPPPSAPGVNVCAPIPGGTYTSPLSVSAVGVAANGTVNHMELWIDGTKISNYFNGQINTSVALAAGSHALTAIEVDSKGAYIKSNVVNITVN